MEKHAKPQKVAKLMKFADWIGIKGENKAKLIPYECLASNMLLYLLECK